MAQKRWLAVSAGDAKAAQARAIPCAWLFYALGEGGALTRQKSAPNVRGGLMGIVAAKALESADLERAARDIFIECGRRSFSGVLLDFVPSYGAQAALCELSRLLAQRGIEHFAHVSLAACVPKGKLIVPSALSGGSFDEMLASAAQSYGAQNLCLEIVRMRHIFQMPSTIAQGESISAEKMRDLLESTGATAYFSPEMQCKYFTFRQNGGVSFVLFDDEQSCAAKLASAENAGFYGAFMLFNEWGH